MIKIALLGDYDKEVIAHQAIPIAVQLAAEQLEVECAIEWINTTEIESKDLSLYQGFWCVPASPYQNPQAVLAAIEFVRTQQKPFLGTCGGYQHAIIEFAKNVLGHDQADSAENNPDTSMPLINEMFCEMREKPGAIHLHRKSKIREIYQIDKIEEQYNCGFGINREYLTLFKDTELKFTGFDPSGDPRALEINTHPFYFATAYQPERSALAGNNHPLVTAFIAASAPNAS